MEENIVDLTRQVAELSDIINNSIPKKDYNNLAKKGNNWLAEINSLRVELDNRNTELQATQTELHNESEKNKVLLIEKSQLEDELFTLKDNKSPTQEKISTNGSYFDELERTKKALTRERRRSMSLETELKKRKSTDSLLSPLGDNPKIVAEPKEIIDWDGIDEEKPTFSPTSLKLFNPHDPRWTITPITPQKTRQLDLFSNPDITSDQEEDVHELKRRIKNLGYQNSHFNRRKLDLEKEVKTLVKQLDQVTAEAVEANNNLHQANDEKETLTKQVEHLNTQLNETLTTQKNTAEEIAKLQEENKKLTTNRDNYISIDEYEKLRTEKEQQQDANQKELASLIDTQNRLKGEINDLNEQAYKDATLLTEKQNRIEELELLQRTNNATEIETQTKLNETLKNLRIIDDKRDALTGQNTLLNNEKETLISELTKKTKELETSEDEAIKLTKENDSLKTKLITLQEQQKKTAEYFTNKLKTADKEASDNYETLLGEYCAFEKLTTEEWDELFNENKALKNEKEDLQGKLVAKEKELNKANDLIQGLESNIIITAKEKEEEAKKTIGELENKLKLLEEDHDSLLLEVNGLQEKNKILFNDHQFLLNANSLVNEEAKLLKTKVVELEEENESLQKHTTTLNKRLLEKTEKNNRLIDANNILNTDKIDLTQQLTTLQVQITALKNEKDELKDVEVDKKDLESKVKSLEEDLSNAEFAKNFLKNQIEIWELRRETWDDKRDEMIGKHNETVDLLWKKLETYKNDIERLNNELDEASKTTLQYFLREGRLNDTIVKLRRDLVNAKLDSDSVNDAEIEKLKTNITELEAEKKKIVAERDLLIGEKRTLTDYLTEAWNKKWKVETKLAEKETEINTLRGEKEGLENIKNLNVEERDNALKELEAKKAEIADLQIQLGTKEQELVNANTASAKEIATFNLEIAGLKEQIDQLNTEFDKLAERDANEYEEIRNRKDAEYKLLEDKYNQLQTEKENKEKQLTISQVVIVRLKAQRGDLERDYQDELIKTGRLTTKNTTLITENNNLVKNSTKKDKKLQKKKDQLKRKHDKSLLLENEIVQSQAQITQLQTDILGLQNNLRQLGGDLQTLQNENVGLKTENITLVNDKNELEKQLIKVKKNNDKKTKQLANKWKESKRLIDDSKKLTDELEVEKLARETAEVERNDAQNEVILLEGTITSLNNQKDHLATEKNNLWSKIKQIKADFKQQHKKTKKQLTTEIANRVAMKTQRDTAVLSETNMINQINTILETTVLPTTWNTDLVKKSDLTTAQGQIATLTANNANLTGQVATLNADKTSLTNDKTNLTVQVNILQGQRDTLQTWKDNHTCPIPAPTPTPIPHECEKCKHSEYIVNELKLTEFNKDTELTVIVARIKELLGQKSTKETITVADEEELNKAELLIEKLSITLQKNLCRFSDKIQLRGNSKKQPKAEI